MNSFALLENDSNDINILQLSKKRDNKQKNKQIITKEFKEIKRVTPFTILYECNDIWRILLEYQEIYSLFKNCCLVNKPTYDLITSFKFLQFLIVRNTNYCNSLDVSIQKIAQREDKTNVFKLYNNENKEANNRAFNNSNVNTPTLWKRLKVFKRICLEMKVIVSEAETDTCVENLYSGVRKFVFNYLKGKSSVKPIVKKCDHLDFTTVYLMHTDELSENGKFYYYFKCKACSVELLTRFYPKANVTYRLLNEKVCNYRSD